MIMRFMRQKFHLWVFWTLVVVLAIGLVLPGVGIGQNMDAVAVVGKDRVSLDEYNKVLSQSLEAERSRLGGELSEADAARLRKNTLNDLINEKLALQGLKELGLSISDQEVRQTLMNEPQFRDPQTGQFDQNRYNQFLNAQTERGMDYKQTEALIAKSLQLSRGRVFFNNSIRLSPQEIDQALKGYHRRARASLLVWDYKAIQASIKPGEDELRTYYAENRKRWAKADEIKARHILIKADALVGTAMAKAKADELYRLAKNGEDFAKLAEKNSQDEASAKRGGDLGYFGRGQMVAEFEAKAFALKQGEIGEPVLSQFGWHIIKKEGSKAGFEPTFENTRAKALEDYAGEKARKQAREMSARAANLIKQGKPLAEAAKETQARLSTSAWFGAGEKSLVPGLGDSSNLADELLFLGKGETLEGPVHVEKGIVLGGITEEQAGSLPKAEKLAEAGTKVKSRLRQQKAAALYEGWLIGLKDKFKVVDRYEKMFGN